MRDENKYDKAFPDALVCRKCGKVVERGIVNVVNHYDNCNGEFGAFDEIFDADYEVIQPKLIEQAIKTIINE